MHMNDISSMAGKFALVTGGSRGIGAAIVRRLALDGAAVAFTYQSSTGPADELVADIEACGGTALAIKADSADAAQVEAAVAQAAKQFGRLDVLVNNAGILSLGEVDGYALADFDRVLAVNVRAVFVAVKAAIAHMGRGGRIIAIGSVAADRAGFPGTSAYCMSKAAVAGLVRGLARDLGPRGITVNAVQPGPTETGMTDDESVREMLRPLLATGRLSTPDEVAGLVAYLVRPEAAAVTGSALTIDGGYLA
jgi:3-oxoacyl-[acyl-carrier protein] reductase